MIFAALFSISADAQCTQYLMLVTKRFIFRLRWNLITIGIVHKAKKQMFDGCPIFHVKLDLGFVPLIFHSRSNFFESLSNNSIFEQTLWVKHQIVFLRER